MIIALAGHVDHGKTALVRALTGIDPDRLPDEKARGMTIDLGFAHTVLPDGSTVGFVDVPGHERFLTNMLAGVLSIDSVLLVVAADDGPMPQTHEHLAVLQLTGVTDIAVAVTKIDRVDAERVAAVCRQMSDISPRVMPVSAITGAGMDMLRNWITAKAAAWRRRSTAGKFRLAVDRGFLVPGTGLVVTGTVASGSVAIGDRLLLSPEHLAARVRGIQVHHAAAETAAAGDRCALAITGARIEKTTVHRGDFLIAPSLHAPTDKLDIQVRTVESRTLKHASLVHVHIGSASLRGRAMLLGEPGFVHLALHTPIAALSGDRIILRDGGTGRVVAGGRVIDPFPPMRRVPREQRLTALTAMAEPHTPTALAGLLQAEGWVDLSRFGLARNLDSTDDLTGGTRIGRAARAILVSDQTNEIVGRKVLDALAAWHDKNPALPGPGKAALLAGLRAWPEDIAEAVLLDRLRRGDLVQRGAIFHLPSHQARLAPVDTAAWKRIEPMVNAEPLRPPRVREIAALLAMPPDETEALLVRLERFGLLLRVAPNRFYPSAGVVALAMMAETVAAATDEHAFTAGMFNQRSGIGRNLTIQVLEYLDKIGVTQRVGEYRRFVRPADFT